MYCDIPFLIFLSYLILDQTIGAAVPTSRPSSAPTVVHESKKRGDYKDVRLGVGLGVAGAFGLFLIVGAYRVFCYADEENKERPPLIFGNPSKVYVLNEAEQSKENELESDLRYSSVF
eukprot:gene5658-6081_t